MGFKTHFDKIGYFESVLVICKDYLDANTKVIIFTLDNDFENGTELKFGDVYSEALKRGFKQGTILLILESFLNGEIYRYGNYRQDEWALVGNMYGFA